MAKFGDIDRPRQGVRVLCAAMLAGMALGLASCNSALVGNGAAPGPAPVEGNIDVLDKVRSLDLLPRYPKQVGNDSGTGRPASAVVYNGSNGNNGGSEAKGEVVQTDSTSAVSRPRPTVLGDGYELNFENTPMSTVAKVVIGDILQSGYTIDPRIQGTITLASVRPVPKSDILFVLESALRTGGVALTKDSTGYHLIAQGDAAGAGGVEPAGGNPEPGYGISVVPLQYVSAQTLLKLLDSFALKPGTVRADPRRNLLLVQGSGPERRAAVDAALSFDADWMKGQSVGIFPINNSNPEPIIAELEKIMDAGENGLSQHVVKFQIVSRMNAIMVITAKPAVMRTAETWIRRLDTVNSSKNTVHVYHVKYGEARQLARVLTEMFIGGASSQGAQEIQGGQLAPGSGSSMTSSADRLSAGGESGQSGGFATQSQSQNNGVVANRGFGGMAAASSNTGLGSSSASASDSRMAPATSGSGKPILEGVRITADVVNNTLLIYADRENYRIIQSTLVQLDRPQLQVAIDSTIAEVTLNDSLTYGVQAFLTSKSLGLKPDTGSILNTQTGSNTSGTTTLAAAAGAATNALINRALPGFNFLIGSEASPNVILDALHTLTDVKVLSNPSLVVVDNQVATLQVGDQVPVSTGSATVLTTSNTIVNTIDYRNTGIILRVSPRVNVNGNVRLEIEQEISNVSPATSGSLTPTVSQRRVKSAVSVASGQTVLLAGLISETRQGNHNGIPILDDMPDLGIAFSHTAKAAQRTELIIFIRPQIIRDGTDASLVAEELRSKLRGTVRASTPGPYRAQ